jgi:hypothetical protein
MPQKEVLMNIPYWKRRKLDAYLDKEKKKKLNDLDKYLIFAFTNLIIYTIADKITFVVTGQEQPVLTAAFFGVFGGEVLICALIKKLKLHKEKELPKEDDYGT